MTIFDIIGDILFTKKGNCLQTVDQESEFQPYIVNRWLSMHSPLVAKHSNILNKYLGVFDNKKDLYNLFLAVFPKVSFKKINYIKKVKEKKEEQDENIKLISKNLELSEREINQYVAFLKETSN
jgi:hypothetical protein